MIKIGDLCWILHSSNKWHFAKITGVGYAKNYFDPGNARGRRIYHYIFLKNGRWLNGGTTIKDDVKLIRGLKDLKEFLS